MNKLFLTVAAVALAFATNANAGGGFAPVGYTIFCMNNPGHCRPSAAATIPATADAMAEISRINTAVNALIRPKRDATEQWSLNPSAGDCEDFALTKRARLIRAGFPAGALRMAEVTTGRGERHAVLIVKTTAGEYVLDNLRQKVVSRGASGYRFGWIASANPLRGE